MKGGKITTDARDSRIRLLNLRNRQAGTDAADSKEKDSSANGTASSTMAFCKDVSGTD
jgi:hypothetical protein